jgi:hypothetical protein
MPVKRHEPPALTPEQAQEAPHTARLVAWAMAARRSSLALSK